MHYPTFEKGEALHADTKFKKHAHLFNVVAVNEDGQAKTLELGPDQIGLSQGLNDATILTGASSARAGKRDNTIDLSYGYRPTSPYYDASRDFD
ncbi:MAG: hypothetical protein ACLFR0_09350 [Alphaproteobacteria bacterium]